MPGRMPSEGEGAADAVSFYGDFSQKLAANTFFNFVGRFWTFIVTLLLTPYILSHLSVGEFGVWVLLSVFVGSFSLLDAGLGFSFIKYVSEFHAHRDYDRINRVLFSGLAFYVLFGAGLVALGLALRPVLFGVFRFEAPADVYFLVLIAFAVNNLSLLMLSMLRGLQRMDQSNAVEILMSFPGAAGTVVLLELGMGLFGLALNAVLTAGLTTLAAWLRLRRVAPEVRLGWKPDLALTRRLFRYGLRLQVGRLGALVCFQLDKLIISRFLGVAAVSFYEVSARLALFMRALPFVMISALIPAVSELGARDDRIRILKAYRLASKYVAILTIGLVALVVLDARSLLLLWLGPPFEQSAVLVQVLVIGYGANALAAAASQTGSGVGRPDFDMRGAILLTVLNPLLSLLLVRPYGATGVAVGTSLALAASAVYVLRSFHRGYVGDSGVGLWRELHLRPWIAGLAAMGVAWSVHPFFPAGGPEAGRLLNLVRILLDVGVFLPSYVLGLALLGHVNRIDLRNLTRLIAFGLQFLRFSDRTMPRLPGPMSPGHLPPD